MYKFDLEELKEVEDISTLTPGTRVAVLRKPWSDIAFPGFIYSKYKDGYMIFVSDEPMHTTKWPDPNKHGRVDLVPPIQEWKEEYENGRCIWIRPSLSSPLKAHKIYYLKNISKIGRAHV